MTNQLSFSDNCQVEQEEEKKEVLKMVVTTYNLRLVKEKTINYEIGLNEKITGSDKVHGIMTEGLEIHLQLIEYFYVLTLDTKNKITGIFEVSRGTLNASIVHPRDVFQRAILQNANCIMLVHNHPSGDTTPSREDLSVTKRLEEAGNLLGIKVLDHIIIGDEYKYLSFKQEGLI